MISWVVDAADDGGNTSVIRGSVRRANIMVFCSFLLNENLNKPLEDYYKLFNCSNEELKILSKEQFIETNKLYGLVWSDQEELPLRQVS